MNDSAAEGIGAEKKEKTSCTISLGTYDGGLLGFSINEGTVKLKTRFAFTTHSGCIKAIACSDEYLVTGSTDEIIRIYSLPKKCLLFTINESIGIPLVIEILKNKILVCGIENGSIYIWKLKDLSLLKVLNKKKIKTSIDHNSNMGSSGLVCGRLQPQGRVFFSSDKSNFLYLWDMTKGLCASKVQLKRAVKEIDWAPSGERFALMYDDLVEVVEAYNYEVKNIIAPVNDKFTSICFVEDNMVLVGSRLGQIIGFTLIHNDLESKFVEYYLFNGNRNFRIKSIKVAIENEISTVIVSCTSDGELSTWKLPRCLSGMKSDKKLPIEIFSNSVLTTGCRVTCMTSIHNQNKG